MKISISLIPHYIVMVQKIHKDQNIFIIIKYNLSSIHLHNISIVFWG
jgi:hypothetical protein